MTDHELQTGWLCVQPEKDSYPIRLLLHDDE